MGLWVPPGGFGAFGSQVGNGIGVRPSDTIGTSVTPGNNTYGSYAQLIAGASVPDDIYGIFIHLHGGTVSGAARDIICTIGVDPAGGTTYTDTIPHLLASASGNYTTRFGALYYFPLFINAGSSIGCKASVNNATVGAVVCLFTAFSRPRDARLARVGSRVEAIGAVTASSAGTAITCGTTSDGAWTSLGSLTNSAWWFQQGMGMNDAVVAAAASYNVDCAFGDGSNKHVLIEDQPYTVSGAETLTGGLAVGMNHRDVPAGTGIYGRIQCSATAESNISQIVYALGG